MNKILEQAQNIKNDIVEYRRTIHENPEVGDTLPKTKAYVMDKLREFGYEPTEICESGIVATIEGPKPGKTFLLRADMDALPMEETPNCDFASKNGAMHSCGHDMHTAMLLGAAKLLKQNQDQIEGIVKLVFQPDEEGFTGAKKMIEAGVLENPKVDAAVGMHVMLDSSKPALNYGLGYMTSSCDGFKITVHGNGCHGAMPELGIDPINVGLHIYSAFQNLIARETPSAERAILTFGAFNAGATPNIVPGEAVLMGTLRTYNKELREKLVSRMHEICEYEGKAFGATVDYEVLSDVPSTYSDPEMTKELAGYASEIEPGIIGKTNYMVTPSDDFAFISEHVPTTYFMIDAKVDGCPVQHHNPGVLFNEDALPYGAAVHATCAFNWLNKQGE